MTHNITVEGGTSVRLPTAGKYCDRDIIVTATGGGSVNNPVTISGINLHNVETDIPNTYLLGDRVIAYNGWTATDFIPVEAGKSYLIYSTNEIDSRYCIRLNADKEGAKSFQFMTCLNKNLPTMVSGHDGYFRFSGPNAHINDLEVYEVINFNWKVSE